MGQPRRSSNARLLLPKHKEEERLSQFARNLVLLMLRVSYHKLVFRRRWRNNNQAEKDAYAARKRQAAGLLSIGFKPRLKSSFSYSCLLVTTLVVTTVLYLISRFPPYSDKIYSTVVQSQRTIGSLSPGHT